MTETREYKDGYHMDEMIERIVYWWRRFRGTRVIDGKDYYKADVDLLARRLLELSKNPDSFNFDCPEMGIEN